MVRIVSTSFLDDDLRSAVSADGVPFEECSYSRNERAKRKEKRVKSKVKRMTKGKCFKKSR